VRAHCILTSAHYVLLHIVGLALGLAVLVALFLDTGQSLRQAAVIDHWIRLVTVIPSV